MVLPPGTGVKKYPLTGVLILEGSGLLAVSQKLAEIPGMTSVSIHIGNSDIVGDIIYKDSSEVLGIIASCKAIDGVTKVVWSEQVYSSVPELFDKRILNYFKSG